MPFLISKIESSKVRIDLFQPVVFRAEVKWAIIRGEGELSGMGFPRHEELSSYDT